MLTSNATVEKSIEQQLTRRIEALEQKVGRAPDANKMSLVVFSGELDKLLAAFVIATGAAASGSDVTMFFTFWGTAGLKKAGKQAKGKTFIERMFGWMLPGGFNRRKLSKMDMAGVGRKLMAREMSKKGAPDLPTLIEIARETNVKIYICEMSMSLMGIKQEELIDYPDMKQCGVASFVEVASASGSTLFI